jgi:hypothetical protein
MGFKGVTRYFGMGYFYEFKVKVRVKSIFQGSSTFYFSLKKV